MQEALSKAAKFSSIQGQMKREKELRTRSTEDRRERKERAKPHLLIILPEVLKAFLYEV